MTGQDIANLFREQYDEVQSGYFDNTRLQLICNKALINVYQKRIDDFQNRAKTTDELLPYIQTVTVTPGPNNSIDISQTSTDVPDYKLLANLEVVFYVGDNPTPFRNRATQLKTANKNKGGYGQGTVRVPKYKKVNDTLVIYPLDYICTEAVVDYITNQSQVVITDSAVQVSYTDKFINSLVDEMCVQAAVSNREYSFLQANLGQEAVNP